MFNSNLLLTAESGNTESMFLLGNYYYINKAYSLAKYWIKKAAIRKHADAEYFLGCFYYNGLGVLPDIKKAEKWFIRAARHNSYEAAVSLAGGYLDGIGLEKNSKKALHYSKKATKFSNGLGEYYLGLCYYKGVGVQKNLKKARMLFTKSASCGFKFAEFELNNEIFYQVA